MVFRNSLLQMCRKVEGISPTFGYTIELLSDHISVFIINHTNHLEREGRLEIESLRRIQLLANELRDPEYLMHYFERLRDSGDHSLIELGLNEGIIINLRSIEGGYFPYPIQTMRRNTQAQTIDQDLLKRMIERTVDQKMAELREQLLGRQKQMEETLQKVKYTIPTNQQGFSLCCKAIIMFLFFIIFTLVIADDEYSADQKLRSVAIFDKAHLQQGLKNLLEKTKDSTLQSHQLTSLRETFIEDITVIYAQEYSNLKEWMRLELNKALDIKEESQIKQPGIYESFIKQLQQYTAYLSDYSQ